MSFLETQRHNNFGKTDYKETIGKHDMFLVFCIFLSKSLLFKMWIYVLKKQIRMSATCFSKVIKAVSNR